MVDQSVVEVLTTQVSVTSGGLDLKDTFLNGQERHIESSSAKVEDEDVAFALHLLVETVGDSSRSGLVYDTEDLKAGNRTSVLSCLTLSVVEVGRDGDDSVGDLPTEVSLGSLLHFRQHHRANFLRVL